MSNLVVIQRTKFSNIDSKGNSNPTDVSYGFRIYDNYESVYNNDLVLSEVLLPDLELLQFIVKECSDNQSILNILTYVWENETGLFIDDTLYEFENIKNILSFE